MDLACVPLTFWSLFAAFILFVVGGMFTGAVSLLIGGVGGRSRDRIAFDGLTGDVARVSERLTREQKARAGEASVKKRSEARTDAELMAEARNYPQQPSGAPARPSVLRGRHGG